MNDVVIHPNQIELISCDQAGSIKLWDLSDHIFSHELVSLLPDNLSFEFIEDRRHLQGMCPYEP